MTGTGVGDDGAPSDGGLPDRRHRFRPLSADSRERSPQLPTLTDDAPVPAACPWLHLASDPLARAGHVTDDHRCDMKPDRVPDPGHQLAYCLSANHVSCPYLRSDEAPVPPRPLRAPPIEPIRNRPPAPAGGPAPPTGQWIGRASWVAFGGLIAVATIGALAFLYGASSGPSSSPSENATDGDAAATTAPDPLSATPQRLARLQLTADNASDSNVAPSEEAGVADGNLAPSEEAEASDGNVAPSEEAGTSGALQSGDEASDGQPPLTAYVVNPGDTLFGIAFRLDAEAEAIAVANGLNIYSAIYVGQVLLIPARAAPGN